ncbi:hypothetical protein VTJ04DRAFT_5675 [Mycothermus thermophilus]|uniref:uncharacterized protein n=1 Tax=Humicola insolens TaxID=85995 RepID=UPI0037435102
MVLQSLLSQLLLASLALAAPVAPNALDNSWQYGTGGGLLGLVIFLLDIIVFVEVLKSNRTPAQKLIWCLVVFLFPVLGLIVYYLFSNRDAHRRDAGYEALA